MLYPRSFRPGALASFGISRGLQPKLIHRTRQMESRMNRILLAIFGHYDDKFGVV
jgi:hypothetical protein